MCHGTGQGGKALAPLPTCGLKDADTFREPVGSGPLQIQQPGNPLVQGPEHGVEQARLNLGQQLLDGHQGMQLGGIEPKPRKFVHALGLIVAVTVALDVVDDGGVQVEAHVLDDALDGGPRALQLGLEALPRHWVTRRLEDTVQLEDSVETVQDALGGQGRMPGTRSGNLNRGTGSRAGCDFGGR